MSMKVWPDGQQEPTSWQVARQLASPWKATAAGFRHVGRGTRVDDLVIAQDL